MFSPAQVLTAGMLTVLAATGIGACTAPSNVPAPTRTVTEAPAAPIEDTDVADVASIETMTALTWDKIGAGNRQAICDGYNISPTLTQEMWESQAWSQYDGYGYSKAEAWDAFEAILALEC